MNINSSVIDLNSVHVANYNHISWYKLLWIYVISNAAYRAKTAYPSFSRNSSLFVSRLVI